MQINNLNNFNRSNYAIGTKSKESKHQKSNMSFGMNVKVTDAFKLEFMRHPKAYDEYFTKLTKNKDIGTVTIGISKHPGASKSFSRKQLGLSDKSDEKIPLHYALRELDRNANKVLDVLGELSGLKGLSFKARKRLNAARELGDKTLNAWDIVDKKLHNSPMLLRIDYQHPNHKTTTQRDTQFIENIAGKLKLISDKHEIRPKNAESYDFAKDRRLWEKWNIQE